MARRPLIAGNWKMHKNLSEAVSFASALKEQLEDEGREVEVAVCPPFTALAGVSGVLKESSIGLGAQNVFWEEKGAFTGEISPPMLADLGCRYVIVGHSERRQYFGETDATVNRKAKAALRWDLVPIICVGETLDERERGEAHGVVERQLRAGLEGFLPHQAAGLVIAYEPVWAIGTGVNASPRDAQEMIAFIRHTTGEMYGGQAAEKVRILYGGSVSPANASPILAEPDIDGALVGGASLDLASFLAIIDAAAALQR